MHARHNTVHSRFEVLQLFKIAQKILVLIDQHKLWLMVFCVNTQQSITANFCPITNSFLTYFTQFGRPPIKQHSNIYSHCIVKECDMNKKWSL